MIHDQNIMSRFSSVKSHDHIQGRKLNFMVGYESQDRAGLFDPKAAFSLSPSPYTGSINFRSSSMGWVLNVEFNKMERTFGMGH